MSVPSETDNQKVEELLRDLDKVDMFEKKLLKQISDLNRSMHEGFQSGTNLLAMEDVNIRTATTARKGRTPVANWESVVYSGNQRNPISPPKSDLLKEMEELKIIN